MIRAVYSNEYSHDRSSLYSKILDNDAVIQRIQLEKRLKVHQGCVNSIVWNNSGEYILSGSDDLKLVITNPFNGRVAIRIPSGHRRNIFQAKFLPESGNRRIVSCAVDGSIAYTQLEHRTLYGKCMFSCHGKTVYQVQTTPGDPNTFLTSSEDGTIRSYDTREQESCAEESCEQHVLLDCKSGVNSIAVDPVRSYYLASGTNDSVVRIFDRRMMKAYNNDVDKTAVRRYDVASPSKPSGRKTQITCLQYDRYGAKLLANVTPRNLMELDCWSDTMASFEPAEGLSAEQTVPAGDAGTVEPRNMRVRLRGDWSDTGPSAVPDSEGSNDRELSRTEQLFRDMSQALTDALRSRHESSERADAEVDSDDSDADVGSGQEKVTEEQSTSKEDIKPECAKMCTSHTYTGHRNQRTAIKQCSYWGENLVVAGSDCGHIFMWRRDSGKLINVVEGDKRVVNCVQPHQHYPVLATSGIDYDVKLWTPTLPYADPNAKSDYISQVMERNRKMLEDSNDVVTFPARFMLPLLSLIARRQQAAEDSPSDDD